MSRKASSPFLDIDRGTAEGDASQGDVVADEDRVAADGCRLSIVSPAGGIEVQVFDSPEQLVLNVELDGGARCVPRPG